MEFNSDVRLDETLPIILPDSFQDIFIDLDLYKVLAAALNSKLLPSRIKIKVARICARLPSVRKSISHEPGLIDNHLCFCLNAFESILLADLIEDEEDRIDQLIDLSLRIFRVYSFDELQKPAIRSTFANYLVNLDKLMVFALEKYFALGSSRSDNLSQVLIQILTQSIKKEDEVLGEVVLQAVKKYVEVFFSDVIEIGGLEESALALTDPNEIRVNIENSIKAFEECYHYLEAVKQVIMDNFANRFIKELTVIYDQCRHSWIHLSIILITSNSLGSLAD